MTQAMKPCPFCGGEAELVTGAHRDGGYIENCAFVRCKGCGARSYEFHECVTPDEVQGYASEAWNRRAGDEKKCISCAYCDIDEGMCYRDPNHTGRGMYTLLDTSCSWWDERR